jgi:phosphopantothenoylcysteine decarboxylase
MANILLGVTGSVAAIRTSALVAALQRGGHVVKVVATQSALYFFDPTELPAGMLIRDSDEWPGQRYRRDDPVVHIELRKWADVLLIAPLDANTLAKLAYGGADNCLTCVARAWDLAKPLVVAPAMNTMMWEQPITARQFRQLMDDRGFQPPRGPIDELTRWINQQECGLTIVGPIEKRLACGDVGIGGMSEVPDIVAVLPIAIARSPNSH